MNAFLNKQNEQKINKLLKRKTLIYSMNKKLEKYIYSNLKTKSQKIQDWTKKDVFLNVLVYFINVLIISGLFLLTIYMEGVNGTGKSLQTFLLKHCLSLGSSSEITLSIPGF